MEESGKFGQGREKRLRTELAKISDNELSEDDDSDSPVWTSYTSTDLLTVSLRKGVEFSPRVPVPKKSDISLLRNDGYRVFMAKRIVLDVDRKFLGCQSPDIIAKLIQGEAIMVFPT